MSARDGGIASLTAHVEAALRSVLQARGLPLDIQLTEPPSPELGHFALACFAYAKAARKAPPAIALDLASALLPDDVIELTQATGGYVNIRLRSSALVSAVLSEVRSQGDRFGQVEAGPDAPIVMVEYSSPNTNKPQHLGHVRNNLLGYSVSNLASAAGNRVIRANLVNDRGIHICKSMLAYSLYEAPATPESKGMKGDHFVGEMYVLFEKQFSAEYKQWLTTPKADEVFEQWLTSNAGANARKAKDKDPQAPEPRAVFDAEYKPEYFNQYSTLGARAREMLLLWEASDPATVALWRTMNDWVLEGFAKTYSRLGVEFDQTYFESNTYLLGKEIVREGLAAGVLEQLEDGAVIFDLSRIGMKGRKVLLRSDGTSVYMTQDLGTAVSRFDEHALQRMIYVVADEQEYHFQVLFGVLGTLRPNTAGACTHLSYGMVHLPEGKMKSREGTVVDADDLMDEMHALAAQEIHKRAAEVETEGQKLSQAEVDFRAERIGLAALKFYLLSFTPKATITFDPKKSIDFLGQTGPYCLYAYARVKSLLRKAAAQGAGPSQEPSDWAVLASPLELAVVRELAAFPATVSFAAAHCDPSKVAEHTWRIGKAFASLYNDREHPIVSAADPAVRGARLALAQSVAHAIRSGLSLLGIETLDAM
jgi:arginyl-tRNA synthetase